VQFSRVAGEGHERFRKIIEENKLLVQTGEKGTKE